MGQVAGPNCAVALREAHIYADREFRVLHVSRACVFCIARRNPSVFSNKHVAESNGK